MRKIFIKKSVLEMGLEIQYNLDEQCSEVGGIFDGEGPLKQRECLNMFMGMGKLGVYPRDYKLFSSEITQDT